MSKIRKDGNMKKKNLKKINPLSVQASSNHSLSQKAVGISLKHPI
jgi:hypothetical protein